MRVIKFSGSNMETGDILTVTGVYETGSQTTVYLEEAADTEKVYRIWNKRTGKYLAGFYRREHHVIEKLKSLTITAYNRKDLAIHECITYLNKELEL